MGDVIVMVMSLPMVVFVVHPASDGEYAEKKIGRRQEHGNARA
jgi:hypothetical protein